jgi:hypothetical protein
MSELNPNHPVTQEVHDHWHKVCGVLMQKFGQTAVEITSDDVAALGDNEMCVVADCRGGKFIVRLMTMEEGERLARQEGGLPH